MSYSPLHRESVTNASRSGPSGHSTTHSRSNMELSNWDYSPLEPHLFTSRRQAWWHQNGMKVTSSIAVLMTIVTAILAWQLGVATHDNSSNNNTGGGSSPSADSIVRMQAIQNETSSKILAAMNRQANPCDDFYEFACGTWQNAAVIPDDKSSVALVTDEIEQYNERILYDILKSDLQYPILYEYFKLCNDTKRIDDDGIPHALQHLLQQIDNLRYNYQNNSNQMPWAAVFQVIGEIHLRGGQPFFAFGAGADLDKPTINTGQLAQSGLSLPDESYYLDDDSDTEAIRAKYKSHIERMLKLTGVVEESRATNMAFDVLKIETRIAGNTTSEEQLRNITAGYNPIDFQTLLNRTSRRIPPIAWYSYFQTIGMSIGDDFNPTINIQSFKWLRNITNVINGTSIDEMISYLRWHTINNAANLLPMKIHDEHWSFFAQELYGIKKQPPREKQCLQAVDRHFGHLLGRYYIDKAFDSVSKALSEEIMDYVVKAMDEKLHNVNWIDKSTREAALLKLQKLEYQIAYPQKWEQYHNLLIEHKSYYQDSVSATKWQHHRDIQQIGKPVDRSVWEMNSYTINAYYEETMNHIVMPAGIMQGLYFNRSFHPAINFGGTGATLGHELSHSFDDQGSQFDSTGRFNNWWSASSEEKWQERTKCLVDHYNKYIVIDDQHLDGALTLGENAADVAGVHQAFNAYRHYMKESKTIPEGMSTDTKYVEPYSNDQLWFIAYAQGWCTMVTPEQARIRLKTDVHGDAKSRVNGPLSLSKDFHSVFQCKAGDKMRPKDEDMCDVW